MKIELTETEIAHIMDALHHRANDLRAEHSASGDAETIDAAWELEEIEHDLLEAVNRRDDGWDSDPVPSAALSFVQAGIDAREQVKGTSMAAQRRQEQVKRMMKGTATPCHPDFMNDPVDW